MNEFIATLVLEVSSRKLSFATLVPPIREVLPLSPVRVYIFSAIIKSVDPAKLIPGIKKFGFYTYLYNIYFLCKHLINENLISNDGVYFKIKSSRNIPAE